MTHAIATNRPHLHFEKWLFVDDRFPRVASRGSCALGVTFSAAVALIVRPSVQFSEILLKYQAQYGEKSGQL
jgi:hypothetical protein